MVQKLSSIPIVHCESHYSWEEVGVDQDYPISLLPTALTVNDMTWKKLGLVLYHSEIALFNILR